MSGGNSPIRFDVWGCRGSKSHLPPTSRIGNYTSCYSLHCDDELFVFDGGLGLVALSKAIRTMKRFEVVRRVHVFITHAHLDHWEGLKDADWFWVRENGLDVTVYGLDEAISTIRAGYSHPSFVALDLLAMGTVDGLQFKTFAFGEKVKTGKWTFETHPLNHYSGTPWDKDVLQTAGYRLSRRGGPVVSYLSDHEPAPETLAVEKKLCRKADLAVYDSHFPGILDQRYGHGSQEHSANIARSNPALLIVAGHHGPMYTDKEIEKTFARYRSDLDNFSIAIEGDSYLWDAGARRFDPARGSAVAKLLKKQGRKGRK